MVLYNSQGSYLISPELSLATRKGTQIPNEQRNQRSPASMQAAIGIMQSGRPSVQPRSSSSVYNCMGMVFASRRTCIDPQQLHMILVDDEYEPVPDQKDLQRGDIVVYRGPKGTVCHVGIVVEVKPDLRKGSWEVTVLSQWGADGEYFHLINEVHPSLGEPTEFWTDRT